METENQGQELPQPPKPQDSERDSKKIVKMVVLALVMLAFGAAGGYIWRDREANNLDKLRTDEISSLRQKSTNLENDLEAAKKKAAASSSTIENTAPSAATLDSIKDAIKSGNTAALEGYMAASVNVILAASEAYGPQTPTQAIKDLDYLNSATDPWDFALSSTTLAKYQSGDYKQYFPTTALVGQSANDYVVSFQFDSSGKINGIFMTVSADLL